MALLRDKRWLLLVFAGAAAGCALFGAFSEKAPPFAFSHRVHAEEGLECGDCHVDWDSDDAPGMPIRPGCDLCHEDIDAEKPPERRIDSLFDGDEYKAARAGRLSEEVIFSHLQHAVKPVACAECHADVAGSDHVDESFRVTMAECSSCHVEQSVANDCATCHQHYRTDVAPDTHLFQWMRAHGPVARAHDGTVVNDCTMCHQESGCVSCHQSMPPENHNNHFRRRGHGLHARMNRQSCAACHSSDSCDTCHQNTRPISHTGAFAGTLSTHCLGCHLPIQTSECFTCHKGAPSHASATPLPPGHNPGMNCRLCHGAGQSLPHVDKGDSCTACHR